MFLDNLPHVDLSDCCLTVRVRPNAFGKNSVQKMLLLLHYLRRLIPSDCAKFDLYVKPPDLPLQMYSFPFK